MYERYYHLAGDPFRLSPDPGICFASRGSANAWAYLRYAMLREEGVVIVSGPPGLGKTTLAHRVVAEANTAQIVTLQLVADDMSATDVLRMFAYALELPAEGRDRTTLALLIQRNLVDVQRLHRRVLLIVDEAQNLSRESLEALRLLTDLQIQSRPVLQLFLFGQPELMDVVQAPGMEQFQDRVIARCELQPLTLRETRSYLEYRLSAFGWRGSPSLDGPAVMAVYRHSHGVPRHVNKIASRLLLHGSSEDRQALTIEDVDAVIGDLRSESLAPQSDDVETMETVDHRETLDDLALIAPAEPPRTDSLAADSLAALTRIEEQRSMPTLDAETRRSETANGAARPDPARSSRTAPPRHYVGRLTGRLRNHKMRDVRSAAGLLTQLPAGLSRTLGVVGKQFGVAMAFARSHAMHAAAGAGRWLSLPRSDSKSASDVSFSVAKAVGAGGALVGIALVVFVVTRPGEAPAEFAALETAAGGAISLHDGPTSRSSEQGQQSGERRPDVVLRDTIQASPIRQAQMDEGSMNVAQRGPGTDGAHQPMPQGVLSSAFITTRAIIDPPRDSRAAAQEPTEVGANSVTDAGSARIAGAKTDRRDPTQSASVESGAAHRRTGEPAETLVSNKIIDGVSLSAILEETAPLAEQPLLEAAASNPAGVGEPGDAMDDGASWTTAVDTETPAQEAFTAIAASGEGTSPETPAPPAAVAADPDVSELITKANAAIAANRLLIPESKSAYRYLQQAAAILPDDPGVQRGFRRILARYAELATKAMRAGDYDTAERFTDRGLRVQPNDRATRSLQDEIRAARAEEEARRARQAAAISPPEPPVDRKTEPTGFDLMMQILDGS